MQTVRNLKEVFGGETDIGNAVQLWFYKFHSSDYDQLRALVEANPRETVRKVAQGLNVNAANDFPSLKSERLNPWQVGFRRIE
jgi:predicted transcriptional regulator